MRTVKCVMVGDAAIGKTYAAEAYKKRCYPSHLGYLPTGFFKNIIMKVRVDKEDVMLLVHDTGGQEDYDRERPLTYYGVDVLLLWFNITSPASYSNISEKWYPDTRHLCQRVPCILVGSQRDLRDDQETLQMLKKYRQKMLTPEDGFKLANRIKAETYIECSSVTLYGIDRVFETAAKCGLASSRATYGEIEKTYGINSTLLDMVQNSAHIFNDILMHGMEENYGIRIMVVGKAEAGKSTLTRRLLKLPVNLKEYNSTNGVEIQINNCQVELDSGLWVYKKRRLMSKVKKLLLKRIQKHETAAKSAKNPGSHDFHLRCAKLLQNFKAAEDEYFKMLEKTYSAVNYEDLSEKSHPLSVGKEQENSSSNSQDSISVSEIAETGPSSSKSMATPRAVSKPFHESVGSDDIEQTIQKAKTIKPVNYRNLAKVSFYDFAGQDIFHASHPTFLSPKAIYILVFDLNKMYNRSSSVKHTTLKAVRYFGDCKGAGVLKDRECMFFWLNVIYMFAAFKGGFHPHVILVGTHVDQLPKTDRGKIIEDCFRELRRDIAETPLKDILSSSEFVVDNTKKNDASFSELKAEVLRLAKLQPLWGKKTPAKWLPLDREVQCLKEEGLKVLSLEEVKEVNEGMQVKISDENELDRFLRILHDSGEIIFFSDKILRNYIVLDQVWLIDALKMIITAERFALRIPKLAGKWKSFQDTGVIERSTIVSIFEESGDTALYENHEHVLRLMEKFLFIAAPVNIQDPIEDRKEKSILYYRHNQDQDDIIYIMPCMVQKEIDMELITAAEAVSKSSVLCMVSPNHFLPPAVFQKVLAMCIKKWVVVEQYGQKLIFCGACKFNIDSSKNFKLMIFLVGYAIHVRLESYISDQSPCASLCTEVKCFLEEGLRSILRGMSFSDNFRTCIQCPQFSPIENGGYFDLEVLEKAENKENVTCDDCQKSHCVKTNSLLDAWIIEREGNVKEDHLEIKENDVSDETMNQELFGEFNEQSVCKLDVKDTPITHEHINHARLCNVLVTTCAAGLREILLSQVPLGYSSIYDAILAKKNTLTSMKQLRQEQINLIFPDHNFKYTSTVDQYDITLLYALIRNISAVQPPVSGWGRTPVDQPRDASLGANVERLRLFRNKISGHSMDGRLDDQSFETYWNEIGCVLDDIEKIIGAKGFQQDLEKRKNQVITPHEAQKLRFKFESYRNQLHEEMTPLVEACKRLGERLEELQTNVDTNL